MGRQPHALRELYGLRERLREQFQAGKGDQLQLCLAIAEINQRIAALEATQPPTARMAAAGDPSLDR